MTPTLHPYTELEGAPMWLALDRAVAELEGNHDLHLSTACHLVIGYLCQAALKVNYLIHGNRIKLRPAEDRDRRKIYHWFACSDLTPSMVGPPKYPENPTPSWEEFCDDYTSAFFNDSGDGKGRNFIITADDEEVGTVGYDLLDRKRGRVVLDIWMRSESCCGRGFGSDALDTLCKYLNKTYGVQKFIISPSARNVRAVAAYKKAGFVFMKNLNAEEQEAEFGVTEYEDNILMVKTLS